MSIHSYPDSTCADFDVQFSATTYHDTSGTSVNCSDPTSGARDKRHSQETVGSSPRLQLFGPHSPDSEPFCNTSPHLAMHDTNVSPLHPCSAPNSVPSASMRMPTLPLPFLLCGFYSFVTTFVSSISVYSCINVVEVDGEC